MKVYIKFISFIFFKSLFFTFLVITSLVFILNLLTELEFFKDENVKISFTLFLSLLNSPSLYLKSFHLYFYYNSIIFYKNFRK